MSFIIFLFLFTNSGNIFWDQLLSIANYNVKFFQGETKCRELCKPSLDLTDYYEYGDTDFTNGEIESLPDNDICFLPPELDYNGEYNANKK